MNNHHTININAMINTNNTVNTDESLTRDTYDKEFSSLITKINMFIDEHN